MLKTKATGAFFYGIDSFSGDFMHDISQFLIVFQKTRLFFTHIFHAFLQLLSLF